MNRKSGVLMPISSLYGDYSIGGLGKAAKEFVDFLSDCNFSYWQILPLNIPDAYNSPYQSLSAFAGNPYFIDPLKLYENGLVSKKTLDSQRQSSPYRVEYERLSQYRVNFLFQVFKDHANCFEIESFLEKMPQIKMFCKFMGLKKANENKTWREFDEKGFDFEEYLFWGFIQKRFFDDLLELKQYANKKGIKLIGDMPIYVSYESADVWGNPKLFLLDENMLPRYIAGVPPDYFSEDGQLWGNPLYDWDQMEESGYAWWLDRIQFMRTLFDGIRIDHFRALSSFYAVPYGAENARTGIWMKGPDKKLIDSINGLSNDIFIIAEDLGVITEEVKNLLTYSGYPGMRILQFGFLDEQDNLHLPHNYEKNVVAYTGTHDNNTLLGYLFELDGEKKQRLLSYCNCSGNDPEKEMDSVIKTLFASHADTVILPMQDILAFGSDTRMNTPGTIYGNWEFRITEENLAKIDKRKLRQFNTIYKRC